MKMRANFSRPGGRSPQKGYLLLEAVVSLVILGSGLLGVTRSYLTATRAAATAEGLTLAVWTAQQKWAELELAAFSGALTGKERSGGAGSAPNTNWTVQMEEVDGGGGVFKAEVAGFWRKGRLVFACPLETWLYPFPLAESQTPEEPE